MEPAPSCTFWAASAAAIVPIVRPYASSLFCETSARTIAVRPPLTPTLATPAACSRRGWTAWSAISRSSSTVRAPLMTRRMMGMEDMSKRLMVGISTSSGRLRRTESSLSRTALTAASRLVP